MSCSALSAHALCATQPAKSAKKRFSRKKTFLQPKNLSRQKIVSGH